MRPAGFPMFGKIGGDFSKHWKLFVPVFPNIGKNEAHFSKHWKNFRLGFPTIGKSIVCALALAAAARAQEAPLLGTNERAHLDRALRHLNMTERDTGFAKDHGTPDPVLPGVRRLLDSPLDLPPLADRTSAVARRGDPADIWNLLADWLEVSRADLAPREVPRGPAPSMMQLDGEPPAERLHEALEEFLLAAQRVDGLLDLAFERLDPEDKGELIGSFFAGLFNAEDRPPARDALLEAGIPASQLDRFVAENAEVDPEPAATNFLARLRKVRLDAVVEAGRVLFFATDRLVERTDHLTNWPSAPMRFDTPLGLVEIGTPGDDRHDRPALLVLDPGGDDRYTFAAAPAGQRIAVVVDLAGDDRYIGRGLAGPGTALFGAMALVDASGNDEYESDWAGQAAAFCGAAWLEDRAGADRYRATGFAQAAACWGAAVLSDREGDDVYEVGLAGQAYAGVLGAALLIESGGNDRYSAGGYEPDHERQEERYLSLAQGFSIGLRPFAGGGIAALEDLAGNDVYQADLYGQGASYWYSLGMLLDAGGHDTYRAFQYSQGAGIHLSSGLLADGGGDDFYTGATLVQGAAHDYGVGMLFDQGGRDAYTADEHSQGRAMNNGFALLLDAAGDDAYFARNTEQSQGIGNDGGHREYGSLALLLDLGGADRYSCGAKDGARMKRPDFGLVYDATGILTDSAPNPGAGRVSVPAHGHEPPSAERVNVPEDELIRDAVLYASTPAKQERQARARAELRALGGEGLRRLMEQVHTENVMVGVLALERVQDMPPAESAPVLAVFLSDPRPRTRKVAAYFLGFVEAPEYAEAVRALLKDDEAAGAAARTLGKWRVRAAVPEILPLLSSEREPRRVAAVNALRDIGDPAAVPELVRALDDPYFTVREAAERALASLGPPAARAMLRALPAAQDPARRLLIKALGRMTSRRAASVLRALQQDPDEFIRDEAAEALSR